MLVVAEMRIGLDWCGLVCVCVCVCVRECWGLCCCKLRKERAGSKRGEKLRCVVLLCWCGEFQVFNVKALACDCKHRMCSAVTALAGMCMHATAAQRKVWTTTMTTTDNSCKHGAKDRAFNDTDRACSFGITTRSCTFIHITTKTLQRQRQRQLSQPQSNLCKHQLPH